MSKDYNNLGKEIMKSCLDAGCSKKDLETILQLTNKSLNKKLRGDVDFKLSEINILVSYLNLNPSIFFAKDVS